MRMKHPERFVHIALLMPLLVGFTVAQAHAQGGAGLVLAGDQLPLFLPSHVDKDDLPQLPKDNDDLKFKTQVLARRGPVIVEFVLASCAACNPASRSIGNLVSRFQGEVGYVRLDLNKNLRASFKYDVPEVPTVLLFRNGELEEKFPVYKPEMQPALLQSILQQITLARLEREAPVSPAVTGTETSLSSVGEANPSQLSQAVKLKSPETAETQSLQERSTSTMQSCESIDTLNQ